MTDRVSELEAEVASLRQSIQELGQAARRVAYHMRRQHHRLVGDCDYCRFELGQLERTLFRVDGPVG